MKYLRKFERERNYTTWINVVDESFNTNTEPFAALCLDTGHVYFHEYVSMDPNGHDYIDLGLPSGTLWATMNIGASTLSDSGYYYSWGLTWSYSGRNMFTLDYMEDHENLFNKHRGRLNPDYDAAAEAWHGGWHIPSIDQCTELIDSDYTSTEIDTINGVVCAVVTSLGNGNSVVFPLSGYYDGENYGTTLQDSGTVGLYWTLDLSTESAALALSLSNDGNGISNCPRYWGLSIRPVLGDKNYVKHVEVS